MQTLLCCPRGRSGEQESCPTSFTCYNIRLNVSPSSSCAVNRTNNLKKASSYQPPLQTAHTSPECTITSSQLNHTNNQWPQKFEKPIPRLNFQHGYSLNFHNYKATMSPCSFATVDTSSRTRPSTKFQNYQTGAEL